jgi:hypothetical protein
MKVSNSKFGLEAIDHNGGTQELPHIPVHILRYEDLMTEPEETLRSVLCFVLNVDSIDGTKVEALLRKAIAEKPTNLYNIDKVKEKFIESSSDTNGDASSNGSDRSSNGSDASSNGSTTKSGSSSETDSASAVGEAAGEAPASCGADGAEKCPDTENANGGFDMGQDDGK